MKKQKKFTSEEQIIKAIDKKHAEAKTFSDASDQAKKNPRNYSRFPR
jgi:hypothetical protein